MIILSLPLLSSCFSWFMRNYICNTLLLLQLSSESDETAEKLSATSEEIIILRGELASERDISRTEIDGLQEQCQRLLRQNSSLLKSMATMENDLARGDHPVQ